MSLETIVSKMIAANEPESNIAKVIKYHKKDSSKINCEKCNHSWKVADGGNDLYTCHECGYNNNKSPLKAVAICPDGSDPDEFGKCNEDKELNLAKDAMIKGFSEDAETKKRNNFDQQYAGKMSAQAPVGDSSGVISNTREEILERRKKCPEGFKKDTLGNCVEIVNIKTEQLEEVEIFGRKRSEDLEKIAIEQAYDFNENEAKNNQGTTGKKYQLTGKDLEDFKTLAVDHRTKRQDFEKNLKSTLFKNQLDKKIEGLLERVDLIESTASQGGFAKPKIRQKENIKLVEARDEYLKTGEWPFTMQQEAELQNEVKIDLDKAMREYSSNVPETIRKYNAAVMTDKDKFQQDEIKSLNKRQEDNIKYVENQIDEFDNLTKLGTDDPERLEDIRKNVFSTITQIETDQEQLLTLGVENKDLQASLDYVKRDHSISKRLSSVISTGITEMALAGVETLNMATGNDPDAGFGIDLGSIVDELAIDLKEKKDFSRDFLPKPIEVGNIDNVDDVANYVADTFINFVNSGIVMGIGSLIPGAAMPLFFSLGYSSRMSRFLLAQKAAEKALPALREKLKNPKNLLPGQKEFIEKQINQLEKDFNVSDLVKFGTSTLGGLFEGIG